MVKFLDSHSMQTPYHAYLFSEAQKMFPYVRAYRSILGMVLFLSFQPSLGPEHPETLKSHRYSELPDYVIFDL